MWGGTEWIGCSFLGTAIFITPALNASRIKLLEIVGSRSCKQVFLLQETISIEETCLETQLFIKQRNVAKNINRQIKTRSTAGKPAAYLSINMIFFQIKLL